MADTERVELPDWFIVGSVVYLGVNCPDCGFEHPCDAVCMRFSPRMYYCLTCKAYKRHKPIQALIKAYQIRKLLEPSS